MTVAFKLADASGRMLQLVVSKHGNGTLIYMANNYLEQLVAEWYEYRGYFVRTDVWVGKRPRGGYECELDVIAFHPGRNHLVHIEPSMDSDSWERRERRYKKKFEAGKKYIPQLFQGFKVPEEIEQIALFGYGSVQNRDTLAGGKILLVRDLLGEILNELRLIPVGANAVPEQHPILRTLQFVAHYRKEVIQALAPAS